MFVAYPTNGEAFADLITAEYTAAFRLGLALLHDRSAAEDAVQEAAFKAWVKIGQFRQGSSFRSWFLGIVANECRSATRRRWWLVLRMPELRPIADLQSADETGSIELRRALNRLSHDERVILILRFYVDLPYEEIGQHFGITAKAARTRTERALKRLRPMLRMQEVIA
jgi:RNA polymerase sigma-70 factor (ECF subfamily)